MSYGPACITPFIALRSTSIAFLGAPKPANLPVEQPTKFELAVNLQTAKQIGVTIPTDVLALADRVIK